MYVFLLEGTLKGYCTRLSVGVGIIYLCLGITFKV